MKDLRRMRNVVVVEKEAPRPRFRERSAREFIKNHKDQGMEFTRRVN